MRPETPRVRTRCLPSFLGLVLLLVTLGGSPSPRLAQAATVSIAVGPDLNYHPKTLEILAGDTVQWTLAGGTRNSRPSQGGVEWPSVLCQPGNCDDRQPPPPSSGARSGLTAMAYRASLGAQTYRFDHAALNATPIDPQS